MNHYKTVSKLFFYIGRGLAIGYLGTSVYSLLCILTGWGISPYGAGKYLHINYPFTQQPFLNIDNNFPYIVFSFLLVLTLYGLFFWISSDVFKVFFQPKLFTLANIMHLKRFYLLNWLVPAAAIAVSSFFVKLDSVVWLLLLLHFMLGIFAWFLAGIFKQGLHLQNEQDLII